MWRRARVAVAVASLLAGVALPGCDDELIRLGAAGLADAGAPDMSDDGAPSCPHAVVPAGQVLWIGDYWITQPGGQVIAVEDLARASGAIGPLDSYTVADIGAGETMSLIAAQYSAQAATATKPTVLIMDGGSWDTYTSGGSDASVASVAATFNQLLSKIASDGTVQQIVYFLVPELPAIPGVAALHPLMQQACANSAVPCHFVDLQSAWVGHPEYTAGNGILPTDAGAAILAAQIWAAMQGACVAQ